MAAQAHASHITPKQLAADRANLRKARAVARGLPRTARQRAASRRNLVHARAAQAVRRQGKKYVSPVTAKKPKAATLAVSGSPYGSPAGLPEAPALDSAEQWRETIHLPGRASRLDLHVLPACAAVAAAASLRFWTGITASPDEILALHAKTSGEATFAELLELITAEGFAGCGLESFHSCDPDAAVPGLVYGLSLDAGYHAVLATAGGMRSWGRELPWAAAPEEAWFPVWEDPDGGGLP